jgi:DNA-binding beta-propeller fold protein YncE
MSTPLFRDAGFPILPFSITVDSPGKYAYLLTLNRHWVCQIGASGSLMYCSDLGNPGASAYMVAVDPIDKFAYIVVYGEPGHAHGVMEYKIEAYGDLTALGIASSGLDPTAIAIHPSGSYAYVTNSMMGYAFSGISQYTIGADGRLAHMQPPSVIAGQNPYCIAVDPSGKYAYAVNAGDNNISQYVIGASGALSPMYAPTVAAGTTPQSIAVDPSSKYVYVTNWGGNNVSQYTVSANGALVPMTPAVVVTGAYPEFITVDPSGKYAYVTNRGSATVSQYTIGSNGSLTPMPQATVATGSVPRSMAIASTYE